MDCYITRTGSYLPGSPVENEEIESYLGSIEGDEQVKPRVLAMNGILQRYYAQDHQQQATADVYQLATEAAQACLAASAMSDGAMSDRISYLSAGTTYAPLAAPGIASILHGRLQSADCLQHAVEISSHAGICSSAATAMVSAIRAVASGEHAAALCVGAEHASEVLKSTVIRPTDDRDQHENIRHSQWFMSVFLRYMLSDGAGALLLQNQADPARPSLRVNWTHARSYAHEAPLCMQLVNRTTLLTQNLSVLQRYLFPTSGKFLDHALETHHDQLDSYTMILPHISSFFFRRKFERVLAEHCRDPAHRTPYWTNLATTGNTGAASIYVMLDHYLREHSLADGDRLLLFVPESGQFNFVLVSLTAVVP